MEDYTTDDEDLADEILAGSIDVHTGGTVDVTNRQPAGTQETAFFDRVVRLVLDTARDVDCDTEDYAGRMYTFLSASDTFLRVTKMIDDDRTDKKLVGTGLKYDLHREVYVSNGDPTGDLSFTVWLSNRARMRRTPPSSPVRRSSGFVGVDT